MNPHTEAERGQADQAPSGDDALRFRALFLDGAVGITTCAPDGRLTAANPAVCRLLGYAEAEILGRTYLELTHPDDRALNRARFEALVAGEADSYTTEKRYLRKDGRPVWCTMAASLRRDGAGRPVEILKTIQDIAALKDAQDALRAGEAFKQGILDAVPDNIAVLDPDGVIVAVNEPWRRFARENGGADGAPAGGTGLGVNYLEVCETSKGRSSQGALAARDGIRAVLDGRLPDFVLEYPCHAPAQERWFTMTVTPLGAAAMGTVGTGWVVVKHTDITMRKRAEDAVLEQLHLREQLAHVAETVPGLIYAFRLGPAGRFSIPYASPALRWMFGMDPGELAADATPALERIHPDDLGPFYDSVAQSARDLAPWHGLFRWRHPRKGDIWIEGHSVPRQDHDGGVVWHGFLQDVTERKETEDHMRSLLHEQRAILDNSVVGIAKIRNSVIVWANPAFAEMFGYALDELVGQPTRILYPDDQAHAAFAQSAYPALRREQAYRTEIQQRRRDGTLGWYAVHLGLLSPEGDESIGAFVDISERRQAEVALQESQSTLQSFYDSSPFMMGVVELDGDAIVGLHGNAAVAHFLGTTPERIPGRTWHDLGNPDEISRIWVESYQRAEQEGIAIQFEIAYPKPTGKRLLAATAAYLGKSARGRSQFSFVAEDVTERRRQERAIENQAFVLANIDQGVAYVGEEGRILYANTAFEAMFGYARGELRGRHVSVLNDISSGDNERFIADMREALKHHDTWQGEVPNRRKDGTAFISRATVRRLPLQEETVWLTVQEDITERKRVEERLRQNEKRFRRLYESMREAFALVDMDGRIVDWNPAFQEMLGYDAEEFRQLTYQQITPGRWHAVDARMVAEQIVPNGVSELYEKEYVRKDGRVLPVELRVFLTRDGAGRPEGMAAIVRDISERKRAEQMLRESEERYRRLFDAESDAILLVDCANGKILDANPVAASMYGRDREELLTLAIADVSAEADQTHRSVAARETRIPLRWHRRKDGTVFPVEISGSYFEMQGREVHVAAIRDISLRKGSEDQQRALLEENTRLGRELIGLQERERAELARGLHDELSQHLAAIRAYAGAIRLAPTLQIDKLHADAAAIDASAKQIYAVSHRIMEGLHPHILDQVDLAGALRVLLDEWSHDFPHIRLSARLMVEPARVGDPISIHFYRIVQECLANVARHSGARRVRIFLGPHLAASQSVLRLVVRDDGVGMVPAAQRTGYGLLVMRERVHLLGGHFELWSEPGRGVRVAVEVPVA